MLFLLLTCSLELRYDKISGQQDVSIGDWPNFYKKKWLILYIIFFPGAGGAGEMEDTLEDSKGSC